MRKDLPINIKQNNISFFAKIAKLYILKNKIMILSNNQNQKIRLDVFLSKELQVPRSQILNLIKKNLVLLNNAPITKSGILLKIGDRIIINKLESSKEIEKKSDIFIQRIYEDDDILVINKPPYLATHGAPSLKEESLVDWLKAHKIQLSKISGEKREGIVHRLDKQTSGAMVVAKSDMAHQHLSSQLKTKSMGRLYIAIIDMPLREDLEIECYLARNPSNRLKISKTNKINNARYAKSKFYKLATSKDGTKELVLAQLFTGRTHQIRAHLESINRHIIGDSLYGYRGESHRIMLHSYILHLEHLKNGKMSFKAEIFDDMRIFLENNFDMEQVNEILSNLSSNSVVY